MPESQCHGVPFIALTANAIAGAREMFLGKGFTDYLSKPINSKMLERMIQDYLPEDKILTPEETPTETPAITPIRYFVLMTSMPASLDASSFPPMA